MKNCHHYDNSPLKIYFERIWLPEIKRWFMAYKTPGLLFHTYNGVERMNKKLRYHYLIENKKKCSLSKLMNTVEAHFIPEMHKLYGI